MQAGCKRPAPFGKWGTDWPLPEPASSGEAGAPLLGSLALGMGDVGTRRGRQGVGLAGGGRGFPLSGELRGAAEPSAVLPPPGSLSGGGAFPLAQGCSGRGLGEPSCWRPGSRAPSHAKPLLRGLGLQSSPPPPGLSARFAAFPCPCRGSASALLPWALRVALPGVQGGCPGGASRRSSAGKGEESRRPAKHFQRAAGKRATRRGGEGSPPPGPSGAFCSQPEVCSCGRGGRRGRRAGGGGE